MAHPQPEPGARIDLSLYLVTDAGLCGERGVEATVAEAVAGGVTAVQLRQPGAGGRSLLQTARALLGVLEGTGVPLIIDDRLDVALAAGAAGVHLGQSDVPAPDARRVAGEGFLIGWSASTVAQAEAAALWPAGTVDYMGVGSVFATTTKLKPAPPIGIGGLRAISGVAPVPCVAIGGIDHTTAADVAAGGVAGIAVVSAICAASDPRGAARRLRSAVEYGRRGSRAGGASAGL